MKSISLSRMGIMAGLLLASSCVSDPYQPLEDNYGVGYRETLNEDGSYTLLFSAYGGLEGETLRELWDRRATELCGGTDYEANIYKAIKPTVLYDYYGGRPGTPQMEGYVRCAGDPATNESLTDDTSRIETAASDEATPVPGE